MKKLESLKKLSLKKFEKNQMDNIKSIYGGGPDTGANCPTDYTDYYGQPDCATDLCTDIILTGGAADTPDPKN